MRHRHGNTGVLADTIVDFDQNDELEELRNEGACLDESPFDPLETPISRHDLPPAHSSGEATETSTVPSDEETEQQQNESILAAITKELACIRDTADGKVFAKLYKGANPSRRSREMSPLCAEVIRGHFDNIHAV